MGRCRKGRLPLPALVPALVIAERGVSPVGLRAELRVLVLRWEGWRPRWTLALQVAGTHGDGLQWRVDGEVAEVRWDDGGLVLRAPAPRGPGDRLAWVAIRAGEADGAAGGAGEWAWLAGRHPGVVGGGVQPVGGRAWLQRRWFGRRPAHRRTPVDPILPFTPIAPVVPTAVRPCAHPPRAVRHRATSGYSAADQGV
jgi:hypothetical protein